MAVIPLKPALIQSKARLSSVLSREHRSALTLMMLSRVLKAIERSSMVEQTVIVGGDPWLREPSPSFSEVHWLEDDGAGLNVALEKGFQYCFAGDAEGVLFLPSDLPLILKEDVSGIIDASKEATSLVLTPARGDGGTNGMLIPRGMSFRPLLGRGSFSRHWKQAVDMEYPVAIYYSLGLGLDVDTPEDIRVCQGLSPNFWDGLAVWKRFILRRDKLPTKQAF